MDKIYINNVRTTKVTWFGRIIYYLLPYRRKVVQNNINQVYGNNLTLAEKKHLAQAFYSHLATFLQETISLRFISNHTLKNKVKVEGHEKLLKIAQEGKGVLLLTAHIGNWEYAPLGAILNFTEFTGHFHFIRRTLTNKTIEKILFSRYFKAGLKIIPKKRGSLDLVCQALEHNHAVIFVLDQHAALDNKDGIAVEFFNRKAGTYRSLASIARNTSIPVIPTETFRQKNGTHVLKFHEPLLWQDYTNSKEALYQNTKIYNQAIESMILNHPEQWMWLHKRWKIL